MSRKILHLDLDAFYCAVEEQRDPTLRGKPFAVGGRPDRRGVVASCSYAARALGIRSAMPMVTAVRLYPDLIIRPAHFDAYHDASAHVMARLHDLTPDVEQISIDEAFLDVTLMRDDATDIARALQMVINQQLHLPCSLGVAANKLVAKIANNIGKARAGIPGQPPNAITVVPPGEEAAFLAPLPVRELWGVGPKTAEALLRMGIKTIGELAARPESVLVERFGKHGQEMARRARGIDERPVTQEGEAKSISKETTFASDVRSAEPLRRALRELSDQVGRRLRHERLSGTTVRLKLRWADFTTLTRQTTLPEPTHHDDTIFDTGWALLNKVWAPGQPVRLIGIGVSGFEATERQMGLWDEAANTQTARLKATLDELKDRFGSKIVRRGSELGDSDA